MSLEDHAIAFRILGDVWADEFTSQTDNGLAELAAMLTHGYSTAAERIEQMIKERAEATAAGHACSVDHRTIKSPRCPACGAPRG